MEQLDRLDAQDAGIGWAITVNVGLFRHLRDAHYNQIAVVEMGATRDLHHEVGLYLLQFFLPPFCQSAVLLHRHCPTLPFPFLFGNCPVPGSAFP
jgi:hypothetical protein